MNEKVLRHKEICDGLNELYARKNHDYGDSFHTTFVEEGLAMARIRLGDKFSRFKTLSRLSCNDRDQQQITDESIRDTLLDLANYAIMKNSEGYSDPTAYQAMMNLEIEELRFKKLLRSIKDVCDLADFEIEGRVVLIDKRSGRVWR